MKVKCTSSFYVINKGVFNIHDVVEFDEELVEKLIKQGVVKLIEENQTEKEEDVEKHHEESKEEDYSKLKVKELKELLHERGLDTKGKKQDLIERLKNN